MIKKIKILNYKTHKRTVLMLHPGLNAIWGLPSAGKSNIRKALEWLCFNPYRIGSFDKVHSDFTNNPNTEVQVTLDNDDKVSLKKNSKQSYYRINKEEPYRKFGSSSVPDRISEKLNLSSINFTDQHDPPFLITSSPPEIARTINEITNVQIIDQCIKIINKELYSIKQKNALLASDQKLSQAKLKQLAHIEKAKKYIDSARNINQKIAKNVKDIDEIEAIQYEIDGINKRLENKDKLAISKEYISKAESIRGKLENNYTVLTMMESIVQLQNTIKIAKKEKKQRILEFIKELKLQKRCPTCLARITSDHVHSIKEELE